MSKPNSSPEPEPSLKLDPISEWRALQALIIYFTVLLNRQIRRRWLLEHKCMQDRSVTQRFRPFIFLEPLPTLHKPSLPYPNSNITDTTTINHDPLQNPLHPQTLPTLKQKISLLRARVEKGKELAAEIERRRQNPAITFPTHFCHTCVVDGDVDDVLLTKCGHRVCRTCLAFGTDGNGVYECSICFLPAQFVARSVLGSGLRSRSEQVSSVSRARGVFGGGDGGVGAGRMWSSLVQTS